ncbi:MAG: acetyl-CoA C-acyltransferase [Chloroflexi bacterium]|nr:acetyl-CoA C-acyltransferase [Chloroflexota bacterium]
MQEIYIVDGVRSPIGSYGGSLKDFAPSSLTAVIIAAILRRTGLDPQLVDDIVIGSAILSEFADWPRTAGLLAGIPAETPASLVNFNCGSGMQAVIRAAQAIKLGEAEIVLAGGTEVMSAAPYWVKSARWGQRLGHAEMIDSVMGSLKDPTTGLLMGEIAEMLAERFAVRREEQDELAFASHQKATEAIKRGSFKNEIEPVQVVVRKQSCLFQTDEQPRSDASLAKLSNLNPAFKPGGTVTAGNSSPLNDAAALVLLASANAVDKHGLRPLARIVSYAVAGVEPGLFGYAPVPATKKALKAAGFSVRDIDLFEINEAFAVQYLICEKELELDRDIVNVNGGAIALGHPVAASGPRVLLTLCHELRRRGRKCGAATMCVGGGMGITFVVENL